MKDLSELSNSELASLSRARHNPYYDTLKKGGYVRVVSWLNVQNFIGGYMSHQDIFAASFEIPWPPEEEEGFGVMAEKGELADTEKVSVQPVKYKFTAWRKRCPFMLGIVLTRWNLKFYLAFYLFGIGFVPAEILWERKLNQNSQ